MPPGLIEKRYALEAARSKGGNSLKTADIKKGMLDSGICEQYIAMFQTKHVITIGPNGEHVLGEEIETSDFIRLGTTLFNKLISNAKDEVIEEDTTSKWRKVVSESIATPSETKKTP